MPMESRWRSVTRRMRSVTFGESNSGKNETSGASSEGRRPSPSAMPTALLVKLLLSEKSWWRSAGEQRSR